MTDDFAPVRYTGPPPRRAPRWVAPAIALGVLGGALLYLGPGWYRATARKLRAVQAERAMAWDGPTVTPAALIGAPRRWTGPV
jgi:hypothetical protein